MMIKAAPARVGKSRKVQLGLRAKMMRGFEQAGGWTVRVSFIKPMAVPTASASHHQETGQNCRKTRPVMAPMR